MKENDINIFQVSETHDIGIRTKKLVILLTGYILMIIVLNLANFSVNDHVLKVHVENFGRLSSSDKPVEALIWLSQNPSTLVTDLDMLLRISEDDYAVTYSGNSMKIIRGTIRENDVLYTYDITYRRLDKRWELDGLYTKRERQYIGQ